MVKDVKIYKWKGVTGTVVTLYTGPGISYCDHVLKEFKYITRRIWTHIHTRCSRPPHTLPSLIPLVSSHTSTLAPPPTTYVPSSDDNPSRLKYNNQER